MSELISSKEAKLAWANSEDVQVKYNGIEKWSSLNASSKFCISNFENPLFTFRLKPRTIKLNGIEVPAPFEPKEGERFYYFSDEYTTGYASAERTGFYGDMRLGAWRTEEEIKQVVAALRSVFNECN